MNRPSVKCSQLILPVILVLLLSSIGYAGSPYIKSLIFVLLMYVALAQAWDLVGGYLGYLNLGFSFFIGAGGYMFALLHKNHLGVLGVLSLAGALAAILAGLLSFLLFRLNRAYFALATLGLVLFTESITNNLAIITGGQEGLPIEPIPRSTFYAYYGALSLAVLGTYVKFKVRNSTLGLAALSISIKDDEEAAASLGVNPFKYKAQLFVVSGFFAGLMGGLLAIFSSYVHPEVFFGPRITLLPVVMALLGGSGTIYGPVLGATTVILLDEVLLNMTPYFHLALLGSILVVVGLFMPKGLLGRPGSLRRVLGIPHGTA